MFGKKKSSDTEEEQVKKARPKKEKKKKEPKPKREKRPKKEKKEKEPKPPKKEKPPKKPKPPKPPKPKKPKKPKKKMNPLVLVILLLVVLVIAAAGALVFLMKKQEQKEDDMYGPMYYFAEEDGIESIRAKIGDREIKGGYTPPVDLTEEKEAEKKESEESKDESSEEKDSKDEKESGTEDEEEESEETEDPELAEVDVKLLTDQHLAYITPGDGVEEAEKYMTYLMQEKGFKILTYPEGSEGEIPREAPKATETAEAEEEEEDKKEDKDKEKDEKAEQTKQEEQEEESEEFIPPEEGYYIAAIDNKSTVAEGETPQIKRVRLQYDYNSYTLRLSTANGVVNDLIPPEPEEEEEGSKSSGFSMNNAIETLQTMPREQLQLPKPTVEYEMTPIQGRVVLEGIDFYNIRAYEEGPEDTWMYGGTYYVSSDGESIYRHDEMTGDTTLISGEDILAQARQEAAVLSGNQ